ncbi:MAG TPA: NAD(P)H-hydrate epimerase, partial [Thermoanaerobaculia bacterium]|nr:NAD(P)H-hydrate epimerase [Thermoanaerobaculia bacterium]
MRAVTAAESRAADERTIASGTPGLVLMERASAAVAREVARVLARRPERGRRVVVLAGIGNNGGDGFETARLLAAQRLGSVETILFGDPSKLTGDAAETFRR